MTQDWTYEDFLTFLLILAAQNDLEITDIEKEQIEQRVGKDEFKKVLRIFDQQNDAQRIDTVAQLYKKFESQIGGKENLVKTLMDVFTLNDRHESAMDQYMIMMLKKIL